MPGLSLTCRRVLAELPECRCLLSVVILLAAVWNSVGTAVAQPPDRTQQPPDCPGIPIQAEPAAEPTASPNRIVEARPLLSEESFRETWRHYSSRQNVPLHDVWKLVTTPDGAETVLVCTGDPKGFLYTVESYSDFEMSFEWKYPEDPHGNSGILVFTQDDPRLWPTSIQVQLHHPKAGSVFPSGDATSDNTSDTPGLAIEADAWNHCKIVSSGGVVAVTVNGKKAGEVTGCQPSVGSIAIQSEGSLVHFRRMQITPLTVPATAAIISGID